MPSRRRSRAIAAAGRSASRPRAAGSARFRSRPRWYETATSTARSALFVDGIDGEGAWARRPAAPRQQLRDNIYTLLGQVGENRKPFLKSEAESIRTPTLLIGGGDTKGALAVIWRVLAEHIPGARTAMIPGTRHWMFEQAPQEFCDVVLDFLKA